MVAPNGARKTKKDHPNLPISISEIVEEAFNCFHKGANAIHAHVRDKKGESGYDARKDEYVKMFEAGIIDPAKVARVAVENAASIAGLLITTECVVVDEPEPEAPAAPPMPPGGGMGGMM